MPSRVRPAEPAALAAALAARAAGTADKAVTRLLVKHFLARLSERAPGRAVEVRVPPYAAVQCIPGTTHTRGTPPAVVEADADTWIALALGDLGWSAALSTGRVRASGERSDLAPWLPLAEPSQTADKTGLPD